MVATSIIYLVSSSNVYLICRVHFVIIIIYFKADVISSHGAETVIAIDVGAQDNNDMTNYGDHVSGWYLLWNKINPFAKKVRVCQMRVFDIVNKIE